MNRRIIQIMPAPANLHVWYANTGAPPYEDGTQQTFSRPVCCLALTSDGDVLPMVMHAVGGFAVFADDFGPLVVVGERLSDEKEATQ